MEIKVLLFGILHDLTGVHEERVELPVGARLEDLLEEYARRYPRLGEMSRSLLASVNQEYASPLQPLSEGDEVALLPPVSGGAPEGPSRPVDVFELTRTPIDAARLADHLQAPEDGGVVTFEGIVRNHSQGRRTLYLEYEAYEPMALKKMREIGRDMKEAFAINHVGMVHRLGRLQIGETSVAIVVTAAHRKAAFQACQYGIDRLKQIVPIWKKEYFEDGAVWTEWEGQTRILVESRSFD